MERPPCNHHHLVEFYETDVFLVDTVTDFLAPAVRNREAVVVIATPEHLAAFADAIRARGIDLDAAALEGHYQALDARDVLDGFMVGGEPDPGLFAATVGAVVDRGSARCGHVRIYGEMVALLCAAGDALAALAVEDLWNELAVTRDFSLLCAYPLRLFDVGARTAFRRICAQHSTVIPAEEYTLAPSSDRQQRVVAEMQQENAALRAELRRRRHAALARTELSLARS
jgi:hypothetical protein